MSQPQRPIRAICFDLDDTLCAYWDASKKGLHRAFEICGPPDHTPEEMIGHWAEAFRKFYKDFKSGEWYQKYLEKGGVTRNYQMWLALQEVGIDDQVLAECLGDTYHKERQAALELFPEAEPILAILAQKYPLGLITNGPADVQRDEINVLEIGKYFDLILIEGEQKIGKPHEEVFRRAEEHFKCDPSELLFVGNSYGHDIRPALDRGWQAIWIRRSSDVPPSSQGVNSKPEEKPEGAPEPTMTISSLNQVIDFLLAPRS
ncbi:MAG: HAD family hydrolase [Armatimonadetes bacterium]|nr:HAD family hydrolase [Armatimonadota bacterium]